MDMRHFQMARLSFEEKRGVGDIEMLMERKSCKTCDALRKLCTFYFDAFIF